LSYLLSIVVLLVLPVCSLGARLRSLVHWPAFAAALLAITVVGCSWSIVLTSRGWWSFGTDHVLGWRPVPNLLVEELLFYPAGGALSVLLYAAWARRPPVPQPRAYVAFLIVGTLASAIVSQLGAAAPYYLYSQLVVYNAGVCGGLAPVVTQRIDVRGLAGSVSIMTSLGYSWDVVAFLNGWWQYHAITGLRLGVVPLDDFDFFLFAPTAAISVYELARSLMGAPNDAPTLRIDMARATCADSAAVVRS
jgi:lycopene cyclase domain-containing protein